MEFFHTQESTLPPLLGNQSVLDGCLESLQQAISGAPQIVLIEAAHGLGKTHFLRHIQNYSEQIGAHTFRLHCSAVSQSQPYAALVQSLKPTIGWQLNAQGDDARHWRKQVQTGLTAYANTLIFAFPELEELFNSANTGSSSQQPQQLGLALNQLLKLLGTEISPVFLIDDLIYLDKPTLLLLDNLFGNDSNFGGMIVCTLNSEAKPSIQNPNTEIQDFFHHGESSHLQEILLRFDSLGHNRCHLHRDHLRPLDIYDSYSLANFWLDEWGRDQQLDQSKLQLLSNGHPRLIKTLAHQSKIIDHIDNHDWLSQLYKNLEPAHKVTLASLCCDLPCLSFEILSFTNGISTAQSHQAIIDLIEIGLINCQVLPVSWDRHRSEDGFSLASNVNREQISALCSTASIRTQQTKLRHYLENNSASKRQYFLTLGGTISSNQNIAQTAKFLGFHAKGLVNGGALAAGLVRYQQAFKLLGNNRWRESYDLTLELNKQAIDAATLGKLYQQSDRIFLEIEANIQNNHDLSLVYKAYISSMIDRNQSLRVSDFCQLELARLGHKIPDQLSNKNLTKLTRKVRWRLRPINRIQLPFYEQNSNSHKSILLLLNTLCSVNSANTKLLQYCYGNAILLAQSWACINDYDTAVTYNLQHGMSSPQLWRQQKHLHRYLQQRFDSMDHSDEQNAISIRYASRCAPLTLSHQQCQQYLEVGIRCAMRNADFHQASIAALMRNEVYWCRGKNLNTQLRNTEKLNTIIKFGHHDNLSDQYFIYLQLLHNLTEPNDTPHSISGQYYNHAAALKAGASHYQATAKYYFYSLYCCVIFSDWRAALQLSERVCSLAHELEQSAHIGHLQLFLLLTYNEAGHLSLENLSEKIKSCYKILAKLYQNNPKSFSALYFIAKAELASVKQQKKAQAYYEKAIKHCDIEEDLATQALANELAARHYIRNGRGDVARHYLLEAEHLYYSWGAITKVKHLYKTYPYVFAGDTVLSLHTLTNTAFGYQQNIDDSIEPTIYPSLEQVDDVLDAALDFFVAQDIDQTLLNICQGMRKRSAADKAEIYLFNHNTLQQVIKLEEKNQAIVNTDTQLLTQLNQGALNEDNSLTLVNINYTLHLDEKTCPCTLLQYCARTQIDVFQRHPGRNGQFERDQYIKHKAPYWVMCLPLILHNTVLGVIYLEKAKGSKEPEADIMLLLRTLSKQAAIAISNNAMLAQVKGREQRYRKLHDNAVVGIFTASVDGNLLSANPALANIFNFQNTTSMVDKIKNIGRQLFIEPGKFSECIAEVQHQGELKDWIISGKDSNDKQLWLSLSARMDNNANGEPILSATVNEVSDKVRSFELEQAMQASTQLTKAANLSHAAKAEFISTISHEIRTPLTAINGYYELLSESELNSRQLAMLQYIHQSIDRLLNTINKTLDLAKIESGKLELQSQVVSLTELCTLSPYHIKCNTTTFKQADITVISDRQRLTQIFSIIDDLGFSITQTQIEFSLNSDKHATLAFVLLFNNSEHKQDWQQKLRKVPQLENPDPSLILLDQNILQNLVAFLTGEIWINDINHLNISIPLAVQVDQSTAGLPNREQRGEHVIAVIEDDRLNRTLIQEVLQQNGYQAQCFEDPLTVLEQVKNNPHYYSAYLIDIELPFIDGKELATQLRKLTTYNLSIMLALTGHVNTSINTEDYQHFDQVLHKPINFRQVVEQLDKLIARRLDSMLKSEPA